MVRAEDLPQLLSVGTDRIEWKQSSGQRDAILEAVCALANDLGGAGTPGHLLLGVDKKGQVVGMQGDLDLLQRELSDRLRSAKIQPVPSTSVVALKHGGRDLIVVEVEPYPVPPIVEVDAIAFVRVGSTTRRATQADVQRLQERRPARSIPFDTRPFEAATLDDLDLGRLRVAWAEARAADGESDTFPALAAWLVQRQLARMVRGLCVPTAAAVLVHGRSPQDLLPAAWIDAVRYAGRDVDAPVTSRRTCTGSLSDQLDVAWAWIGAQIENVPAGAEGIRESFVPVYPLEALKELVRNLVQHRLYEGTEPVRVGAPREAEREVTRVPSVGASAPK